MPRWPSMLSLLLVRTIKRDVCQIYNSPLCVFVCVCTYICLFHSEQMWASAIAVKAINTCLEVLVHGCVCFPATDVVICCVFCLYIRLCKLSDILDFKYTCVIMRHRESLTVSLFNWEMTRSYTSCFGLQLQYSWAMKQWWYSVVIYNSNSNNKFV